MFDSAEPLSGAKEGLSYKESGKFKLRLVAPSHKLSLE